MQWFLAFLPNLLLVFCRITAFFVTAPLYSYRGVPAPFKIGFAFFISLFTFFSIGTSGTLAVWDGVYLLSIIKEVLVGLLLGFTAYMFFSVVQIAGSFVDMQMGFGIANVIDPMTGAQSPILGNFKFYLATLLFLAINGHHHLLMAIMRSYEWVPLDNDWLTHIADGGVSTFLLESFLMVFALAFQMVAPLIAALFLVDVGLGMLARTAPQFNVFVVGIPIKIIVGYMILLIMIPSFGYLFDQLFTNLFAGLDRLLNLLGS